MMDRRRFLLTSLVGALAAPQAGQAQQADSVWRIGVLSRYSADYDKHVVAALRKGLHDLGYTEGRSIVLEQRHAEGQFDKLRELASASVEFMEDMRSSSESRWRTTREVRRPP
jgi:hypothetical protein